MFSRPYTTIDRVTIHAADCLVGHTYIGGQLHIIIEPRVPVPTASRNPDPLLSQALQTQSSTPQTTSSVLQNAHSTQTQSTSQNVSTTYTCKTDADSEDDSSNTNPNDIDPDEFLNTPDNEENTITPLTEDQVEAYASLTKEENSSNEIGEMSLQTDRKEEHSSTENDETPVQTRKQDTKNELDLDVSDFIKTPKFQNRIKQVKMTLTENTFQEIERRPQEIKDFILQVIKRYPDILDDQEGEILRYIDTDIGPVKITDSHQYSDISDSENPNEQENHEIVHQQENEQENQEIVHQTENEQGDQYNHQEKHDDMVQENNQKAETNTLQENSNIAIEKNDNEPTIPRGLSPDAIDLVQSDSDSGDCFVSKVSPPPYPKIEKDEKSISQKTIKVVPPTVQQTASAQSKLTPGVSPQVVLRQFPYKAAGRYYKVTITEPRKRYNTTPDTQQASTSTGTYTDTKPRKKKKHHRRDKPQ